MESDWTTTKEEWEKSRRCFKCGRQLFPANARTAEDWARSAYQKWLMTGRTPEDQRDARAPGLLNQLARRKQHYPLA